MASVTAMELVNRVRLFRRQPTTTVIDTPEDQVTLNAVNMAIEDVLSTRRWEFDLRSDGVLLTRPILSDVSLFPAGPGSSTSVTVVRSAGLVDEDVFGDYSVSAFFSGTTKYASTLVRLDSASQSIGVTSFAIVPIKMDSDFTTTSGELHYLEYMLPNTVREVIRATYQEELLILNMVDPVVRYSEIFPGQGDDTGRPRIIAVGGFDVPTYDSSLSAPDPALRMAVWPTPDEEYVINYNYYYRHPELVEATDELVGVPPAVVNDIVLQATSTVMMTWDQNYAASHFTDLSRQQASVKHRASGGSPGRRHTIRSFESGGGRFAVELGFPNKVIG